MDTDEIDTDEEAEKLNQDVYEAQKIIQEAGVIDESEIYERLNEHSVPELVDTLGNTDPAPKGSREIQILNAAEKGKLDVVENLLKESPDLVKAHDQDGYTPLHRACYSNHPVIVEILLKRGANIDAKTCDGWTPLHSACKWNHFHCAALLIDYGSLINPLTNGGQTPLHLAASHPEAKETLYLLLSNPKIAVNIRNQTGELAADIAHRHCKYYKLFELCDPCFNII